MRTEIAIISALTLVLSVPLAFGQVDPEYMNRNSIYANEINNQFEPNILYEYIDSDGVIRNDVYEIFLVDEKPDAPFPKYTDLKLGNFPYYQLTFENDKYQIKSLKENVDVLINPDFCTVHVSNQDEEIIENWQVYSSPWGVDNWQLLPVNDNQCEFEIWNDNQGVYWNFIKENELGKFASGYHYSTWKVESTQSYHNFDQTTQGEIDEDDNIISGNPYKFGFTQNLIGSDFFVDDSFQLHTNIDDELTSSKISYAFADSKDLLWGANENSDGTYFDFKYAKEPTNFNEVLSMDPIWDSAFTTSFANVRDFSDRDQNGRVMVVEYGTTLYGFNENTGNGVWTENSNGGVGVSLPKGGISAKGSGTSNPYTISQYNSNYQAVSWSFNNNNPTTPSIGSTIQSVSYGRGYDHDYSNSNNWCYTTYMGSSVNCSGITISGMNYPQGVEWNNYMNWACVSGGASTSYTKGYVFECRDTSGNLKINTYFGNYATGLHTLIPSSVTSSPVLTSGWDTWDFDDTNGDLHWIDSVNGLVYVFELNPTQTGYVYKDYYGNGMGTGNGQFTNPVAIKLIHNTANTALDYIFVSDYSVGEVEIFKDIPPPNPPTNLSLSQTTANQLDLSWSAPTSGTTPTSYQIDRSLDGSTWTTIVANTGNTGTTYSDTGLTFNTNYYYRVFTLANGIPSATASNTANQITWNVPDQVTGLTGQSGINPTLNWSAPNSDDTITNYKIYRNGSLHDTIGNVLTYSDSTNIVTGTTYAYTVSAVSGVGEGAQSSSVNLIVGTPPNPPVISTAINSPNTAPLDITISITPDSNVGTGTLTGFEIYRDGSLITTTGLVSTYVDTVSSSGTYQYSAKSVSTHGISGLSNLSSITTPTAPPAPTNAPALAINNPNPSPLDIEVSWTEPASGGSIIQSYEIFRSADDITYTSVGTVTDLDFTDTVPNAGTWYYKFTAINLVGSSGLSPSNSIATPTVPSSPLNASSVIPSINSAPYDVTVSWDLPTSTGGSALTGYNVYRQTGTGAFSLITTTTALGYVDTVPTALNQDYTYKIHAVNNVGESTGFTTTTITTFDVPDAPVLSFTTGTTALSWTVPNSDASITGYKIFRDSSLLTTVTTTSHSDFTPINFGQSYQYEVKAVSILGDSASSNSIVTTPETEITGMVVQGITGTGAVIDWEEPAYYQGQITSYSVYYATPATSANPTISAGTTTNTYSNFAPTLDYDTSYTFGVTVNSPLGNSGFSNLVNATTNVDSSIVAYDPNTGGMSWFDIDSVSEQTVNVIEFQRETQNLNVNGTFTDVDTLQVGYPSWWDDMTCNVDYKFAQKTEQYVEGTDMTAVINSADANQQVIGFQFQDIDNEVIEVECAPQQSTQDDGVSAKYIMTQTDLSTGTPNIPLVTQIQAFQTGDYGTDGEFGALDVVGLFVILISMVGFNRLSPIVGVLLSASLVFGLSFFGIISLPTVLVGIIALVIFLAWGITRNR